MKAIFDQIDQHLYELSLTDSSCSLSDLLRDLQKETWEISQGSKDGTFDVFYADPGKVSSTRLKEFHGYFVSNEFKTQVLTLMSNNKIFQKKCQHSDITWLLENTNIGAIWAKTPTRQNRAPMHHDNMPATLAHGLVYLLEYDDPNQSTYFLKFDAIDTDGEQHRIPTGFGCGWIVVATDKSFHKALNNTDCARFCLRFLVSLK